MQDKILHHVDMALSNLTALRLRKDLILSFALATRKKPLLRTYSASHIMTKKALYCAIPSSVLLLTFLFSPSRDLSVFLQMNQLSSHRAAPLQPNKFSVHVPDIIPL